MNQHFAWYPFVHLLVAGAPSDDLLAIYKRWPPVLTELIHFHFGGEDIRIACPLAIAAYVRCGTPPLVNWMTEELIRNDSFVPFTRQVWICSPNRDLGSCGLMPVHIAMIQRAPYCTFGLPKISTCIDTLPVGPVSI